MKNGAPHLPPKVCRVDTYYRLQNVRWLLLFAFLAFIAGGSAALIFEAYVMPEYSNSTYWMNISPNNRNVGNVQPEIVLQKQMEQRLLTIYDARKKISNQFYKQNALVAKGAVISSDGWLVALVPDYIVGMEKNWELIDYQGSSYKIEKVLFDKLEKVLYVKVSASGLRVVSFPTWQDVVINTELWTVNSNWQATFIKKESILENDFAWLIWQPQINWQLADNFVPGTVTFNNQGQFVGIVNKDGLLSHGWLVEKQISPLLTFGKLEYFGLPWQGYFVQDINKNEGGDVSGFYVEKIGNVVTGIVKGDTILKINKQDINVSNLAFLLWTAPNDLEVVVWRNGGALTLKVSKTLLTF